MSTTTQWILELVDKISGPMKGVTLNTDKAVGGMHKLQFESGKAMDAIQSQVPGVSGALGLIANPYVAATAAAVALGTVGYKAVDMANDWREGLAKVNVTAELSKTELDGLSKKLLAIGMDNVAPINQIPESFNKIISAGLDVNTSLQVLSPTLKAAKAGFTDVGETAKAAVAVMNASGEDINKTYDVLFATLNKGNAEFADIAQYLPKLVPMARDAGFALGETAGAWAYLTAQGQTSERATTLAQNAMKALTDPQKIDAFKQMGIAIYDSAGKVKPLVDIVDQLRTKTKGLSDLGKADFYGKIGLDQEAGSFFKVAVQDAEKFRKTIDFTTNSQGALNKAVKDSATPMERWKEVVNVMNGYMIMLGEKALPFIEQLGEKISGVIKWVRDLYDKSQLFRDVISGIGTVITSAFKIAFIPLVQLWNYIKLIGMAFSWVSEKVFGFSGGIEEFYNKVRPYLIYLKEMFGGIADIMYKIITFDFKGAYESFKTFKMPNMEDIRVKVVVDDTQKDSDIKKPTPKLNAKGLLEGNGGTTGIGSGNELKGSGSSSGIKNISQKIDIKNYFTVSGGAGKAEFEAIAEKVVRAINEKLSDGIVAAT